VSTDLCRLPAIGATAESGEPAEDFWRRSRNRGAASQKRRSDPQELGRGLETIVDSGSPSIVRGMEHTSAIHMQDQRARNDS